MKEPDDRGPILVSQDFKKLIWELHTTVMRKLSERVGQQIPYPNKLMFASRLFDDIKSEESWKAFCANTQVANHLGKTVSVESFTPRKMIESSLGIGLIGEYLNGAVDAEYIVESLSDFFQKDTVTLVARAPIYGLSLEAAYPFQLDNSVQLVLPPLSDEFTFQTPFEIEIRPSFVFEHRWLEKKTIAAPTEQQPSTGLLLKEPPGLASCRKFVYTLLLLGKYRFRAPFAEIKVEAPVNIGYKPFFHAPPWVPPSQTKVDHMNHTEVDRLKSAWKDFASFLSTDFLQKNQWLTTALDRMEIAYERDFSRDSIIDICTSLEALLSTEIDELSYRFKQRGSFLYSLGKSTALKEEVEGVRETLRKAYVVRSRFVHGDDPGIENDEMEHVIAKSTEFWRICCLKLLALSESVSHKNFLSKDLDLAMTSLDKLWELERTLRRSPVCRYVLQ